MMLFMKQGFTDLHTHILPSVDDGVRSMETALELLRLQKHSGVERVMLTPHFYPQTEAMTDFLARRNRAYAVLMTRWEESSMPQVLLGAEVHYSPALVDMDLEQITLGNGNYLLLELPDDEIPACVEQVIAQIRQKGITPILAHVERCAYFLRQPEMLLSFVQAGALGQISAKALQNKKDRHFGECCIKNGLAHIVASDLHSKSEKKFCLGELAEGKYGELMTWTESFAQAIWRNTLLPPFAVRPVKRNFLGYY